MGKLWFLHTQGKNYAEDKKTCPVLPKQFSELFPLKNLNLQIGPRFGVFINGPKIKLIIK